jgi:hypothetical protein
MQLFVFLHFLFHLTVCSCLVPIVNFLVYCLAGLVYGFFLELGFLELGFLVWIRVVYGPLLVFLLLLVCLYRVALVFMTERCVNLYLGTNGLLKNLVEVVFLVGVLLFAVTQYSVSDKYVVILYCLFVYLFYYCYPDYLMLLLDPVDVVRVDCVVTSCLILMVLD